MMATTILRSSFASVVKGRFPFRNPEHDATAAEILPENIRFVLRRVPAAYATAAIDILLKEPAVADQVMTLYRIVQQHAGIVPIEIGEIVTGDPDEDGLELYIRIESDFEAFQRVKHSIRRAWRRAHQPADRLVAPVILRKVENV